MQHTLCDSNIPESLFTAFTLLIKSFEQDLLDLLKSADGGNEEAIEKLNLIKLTDLHKAVIHGNYDQVFIRLFVIRSK